MKPLKMKRDFLSEKEVNSGLYGQGWPVYPRCCIQVPRNQREKLEPIASATRFPVPHWPRLSPRVFRPSGGQNWHFLAIYSTRTVLFRIEMGCLDFILQFSLTFDALLLPCLLVLPELCSPAREQKMLCHCGVLPCL